MPRLLVHEDELYPFYELHLVTDGEDVHPMYTMIEVSQEWFEEWIRMTESFKKLYKDIEEKEKAIYAERYRARLSKGK